MKSMLVTGGTVFVSRSAAAYFAKRGWQVYVLNRASRPQVEGVTLIQADRHQLKNRLKQLHFDAVLDITAYNAQDVAALLDGLGSYGTYLLISSSAVYPENAAQPFSETTPVGSNRIWGVYGTDKIAAEEVLRKRVADAYVIRPPYLYGPMNNVYREAFVFDCALQERPFYLPGDGSMRLQFFHVEDLCRLMEALLDQKPTQRIWNAGNPTTVTVREWVTLCYHAAGKEPTFVSVDESIEQRNYFSFYRYEYALNVQQQSALLAEVKPLDTGLTEALAWYRLHPDEVRRKPFFEYIKQHLQSATE